MFRIFFFRGERESCFVKQMAFRQSGKSQRNERSCKSRSVRSFGIFLCPFPFPTRTLGSNIAQTEVMHGQTRNCAKTLVGIERDAFWVLLVHLSEMFFPVTLYVSSLMHTFPLFGGLVGWSVLPPLPPPLLSSPSLAHNAAFGPFCGKSSTWYPTKKEGGRKRVGSSTGEGRRRKFLHFGMAGEEYGKERRGWKDGRW